MKKTIAILLAAMMLFAFAACRENDGYADNETLKEYAKKGEVVEDGKLCTVRIAEMFRDPYFGNTLRMYLENKTGKTCRFVVLDASVNGVDWSPYFVRELAPKSKTVADMQFVDKQLDALIPTFTDIELVWELEEDETSETLAEGVYHYYPQGEENKTVFEREAQPTDQELFDNNVFNATLLGSERAENLGYALNMYFENKSDVKITFSVADVTVNGQPCDPFWADSVRAHTREFTQIFFLESDLNALGITDVETIEMTLSVYESDTFADIFSEPVTIHP